MGQTLFVFLFFCSFGWGPQIIFIIVFSFPFLLNVLNCAALLSANQLMQWSHIPNMAFYKKKELFQIIVEDNWIDCISPFPTIRSDQISRSVVSDSLRPHESQHARPPCLITNSRSSLRLTSIESVMPSSYLILCRPLLLLPPIPPSIRIISSESDSWLKSWVKSMSQLFTSVGQSIGVSALASFLPKKSQGWSRLEWTSWISWQSKGLSRVFSNTTVQKHQFFSAQFSLYSNSHIHTWPLEKP